MLSFGCYVVVMNNVVIVPNNNLLKIIGISSWFWIMEYFKAFSDGSKSSRKSIKSTGPNLSSEPHLKIIHVLNVKRKNVINVSISGKYSNGPIVLFAIILIRIKWCEEVVFNSRNGIGQNNNLFHCNSIWFYRWPIFQFIRRHKVYDKAFGSMRKYFHVLQIQIDSRLIW